MNKNLTRFLIILTVLSTAGLGCVLTGAAGSLFYRTGETHQKQEVIPLKDAASAQIAVRMGAGDFRIGAGSDQLADTHFSYNVPSWKPTTDYSVRGGTAELGIEQPKVTGIGSGSIRNVWDLEFNPDIPLTLDVRLGAGESRLDLSQLTVNSLKMKTGVGFAEVDLTGERQQDVEVELRGGVGEVDVLLPAEVGVRVRVEGGLGEIDARGLTRQGDLYLNDAYGGTKPTLTLDIEGGVGGIHLITVD